MYGFIATIEKEELNEITPDVFTSIELLFNTLRVPPDDVRVYVKY